MPQYAKEDLETKMDYAKTKVKTKVKEAINEYVAQNDGNENIDKQTQQGIKRLRERVKAGEIIVYPTDKSGKLSVDTPLNYERAMQKHIDGMNK